MGEDIRELPTDPNAENPFAKPKAEETLKACGNCGYEKVCRGFFLPDSECTCHSENRRTPAKNEGEDLQELGSLLLDIRCVCTEMDAGQAPCDVCRAEEIVERLKAKPTAPADEGEKRPRERVHHKSKLADHNVIVADLQAALLKYKDENDKLKMGASFNCSTCTTKAALAEKDNVAKRWRDEAVGYCRKVAILEAKFKSAKAVVDAGRVLNARIDIVTDSDAYKSVWMLAHTHGGYDGPQWKNERDQLIAALSAYDKEVKQ